MKKRILLFFQYFIFWTLLFIVFRILFILYHFHLTRELNAADILKVFLYGSKMDFSMAAYLTIFAGLSILLSAFLNGKIIGRIINIYTLVLIFFTSFLVFADMELYRNWGFRMDTTPLMYLKNPKEAAGSTNYLLSVILIIGCIVFAFYIWKFYKRWIGRQLMALEKTKLKAVLVFIPLIATLIIPIRGGFGVAPLNVGSVYFHKEKVFANHAAVNVIWNISYALMEMSKLETTEYFQPEEAQNIFDSIFIQKDYTHKLLKIDKPNIIILIMESFTNKIIEPLGGMKGIAPNFTALSHEGILFSNCYANGDRTDKGILAILNGYPGHPKLALVNFPKKTESLPYLNRDLKTMGYYTEFVYGYDIDYANFRSYFANANYNKVITKDDFPQSECNSKWGVHDHYVFNKLFTECNQSREPFFFAFASQSSHEPFDVPMKTKIPGKDEEHLYLNSIYYADSSLGDFIKKSKQTSWWKNTLIVIIADHGTRHPGNSNNYDMPKYHIPMLWLGGAVEQKDTIITTHCSQTDVAYTLLNQLGIENKEFKFSQNFLSSDPPSVGFYVFNNGFGFLKNDKYVIFDNNSKKTISKSENTDEAIINMGKAYIQVLTTDFAKR